MSAIAEGSVFAGHRVGRVVGRGGMGVVYAATHQTLAREVALKLIAPEYAASEDFRKRFLSESRLAASINHPHVIPVYDAGEADGQLYITMRLIDGTDLGEMLKAEGPLSVNRATDIATQLAGALDAAHERGLVHRDVKPANVLIDGDEVYLTDFGLAKQLVDAGGTTRGFVGTPDYAAPEQINTEDYGGIDARADVYALACVVFHTLAGRPPYPREGLWPKLFAHLNDPIPAITEVRSDVPPPTAEALARAMSKSPPDRFGSAGEFAAALGNPAASLQTAPRPSRAPAQRAPAELSLPCPSGHWAAYPDLSGESRDFHCPQCGEGFTALVGAVCQRERSTPLGREGGKRYELTYAAADPGAPARRLAFSRPTRAGEEEPDVRPGDRFSVVKARGYFHWVVNHLHGGSFWLYPPPAEHAIARRPPPGALVLMREAALPALARGVVMFVVPFAILAGTHVVGIAVAVAVPLALAAIVAVGNYIQRKEGLEAG